MKRSLAILIGAASLAGGAAAQSSVEIYGLIDLGVTMYKGGGPLQPRVDGGISNGSRLGFRGNEDLGGGLSAIFDLEMAVQADIGNVPPPFFGREAWMGLRSNTWGTLTMGRQTDFTLDYLAFFTGAPLTIGAYSFHPGDYDRVSGIRYDNSIKWVSPKFGPVQLGAMVALGEAAGSTKTNMGKSVGATYQDGPLSAGIVYTTTNDQVIDPRAQLGINTLNGAALAGPLTTDRVDIVGVGGGYRFGPFWLKGVHTRVALRQATGSATLATTDANLRYEVTPNSFVGGGAWRARLESNDWTKFYLAYDYQFSKRTDVYVSYTHLKTNAGNRAIMLAMPPSTTDAVSALRVAVMHRF